MRIRSRIRRNWSLKPDGKPKLASITRTKSRIWTNTLENRTLQLLTTWPPPTMSRCKNRYQNWSQWSTSRKIMARSTFTEKSSRSLVLLPTPPHSTRFLSQAMTWSRKRHRCAKLRNRGGKTKWWWRTLISKWTPGWTSHTRWTNIGASEKGTRLKRSVSRYMNPVLRKCKGGRLALVCKYPCLRCRCSRWMRSSRWMSRSRTRWKC